MNGGTIKKSYLAYVLVVCVTMLPLTCGYIMDGGVIGEWIVRMDELSAALQNGSLLLFPTEGVAFPGSVRLPLINSNLWYLLPALFVGWTGSMAAGWEFYMIFMQIVTLFTAVLMFRSLFEETASRYPVFFGVLLYMTCPYRIYVCYDLADMAQVAVWALVPLYLWAVLGLVRRRRIGVCLCLAALCLAGIGYADLLQMLAIAGLTLLTALCLRRPLLLVSLGAGGAMALPCFLRLYYYLFREAYGSLGISVHSIMEKGYRLGEFFSIFVYREGHPGLGLGMLFSLLAGLWLLAVKGQEESRQESAGFPQKAGICFTILAGALLIMSLRVFPWEFVQRLGVWALKLVSLLETPAFAFGLAQPALCVSGAWAMGQIERQKEKSVSAGLALMVMAACLGTCIYQCNMLTYTRVPL